MTQDPVSIVKAFQPPLGFDITTILNRNAPPAVVEDAMAGFAGYLTPDFTCAYHSAGEGEYAGVMGLRELWLDWLEPWESYRPVQHKFVDLGDNRVVVLARDSARRAGMNEEIEVQAVAIYTVRDGRIARAEYFARVEDGLVAAGLERR